jgi:hypothetical protein
MTEGRSLPQSPHVPSGCAREGEARSPWRGPPQREHSPEACPKRFRFEGCIPPQGRGGSGSELSHEGHGYSDARPVSPNLCQSKPGSPGSRIERHQLEDTFQAWGRARRRPKSRQKITDREWPRHVPLEPPAQPPRAPELLVVRVGRFHALWPLPPAGSRAPEPRRAETAIMKPSQTVPPVFVWPSISSRRGRFALLEAPFSSSSV